MTSGRRTVGGDDHGRAGRTTTGARSARPTSRSAPTAPSASTGRHRLVAADPAATPRSIAVAARSEDPTCRRPRHPELRHRSRLPGARQHAGRLQRGRPRPQQHRRQHDGHVHRRRHLQLPEHRRRRRRTTSTSSSTTPAASAPTGAGSAAMWLSTGCVDGTHAPGLLTYGNMFTILPFGNATAVGKMTGAQILEVLNYGAERRRRHPAGGPEVQVLLVQGRQPRSAALRLGRLRRLRRQQDQQGLRAARPEEDLQRRHERVPGAGRRRRLQRLQVHDEHHVLGRHAQRRQRVRGEQLRDARNGLQGPERRRHARRANRP